MGEDITQTSLGAPEQLIGPYELGPRLGAGGMGEVYLATDLRLGRQVALKLLLPALAVHPEARARFLREARSAAALNHPNIAIVFDAGEVNGRLYLVMEYVGGRPLRSLLGAGALPESEAVEYGMQLASALEHAHSRGILHCDIKPENVIVDSRGAAKLVDFGIARMLAPETDAATQTAAPGLFAGTIPYAPPEVLCGRRPTRQSDLYSLGVTLFEMACGQTPFDGLSAARAVTAILQGAPAGVREVNGAVSLGLAEVIERSMALEPELRFGTAEELLLALRAVRDFGGAPLSARPAAALVPSLAILDFTNVSQDPALDWLSVGIVETIEVALRKQGGVQVFSRARVQQLARGLRLSKEDTAALNALGRRLSVKWIVTGSFQRAGDRIRVTAGVFNVSAGETASADIVDGLWEDLFNVQDRVVAALIRALDMEPGTVSAPRPAPAAAPSLGAYEYYASGRRSLERMGRDSLTEAIDHFEKAIALNPDYALAYSGLGAVHALGSIQSFREPELERAREYLERAIELDSELGEPYPWLCYIYWRLGDAAKARAAGERGVILQPDLSLAHYFYSAILLSAAEVGQGNFQRGLDEVTGAIRLDPQVAAYWMMAGSGALFTGQYQAARLFFEGALRIERTPKNRFPFVGALTMLGFVSSRQLAWDAARHYHQEAIESLRSSEHVYRDSFVTLSACGLGEIELRNSRPAQALQHFRHAWRIVQEQQRMVSAVRLGIRAEAGMAAAYAALGDKEKAERHLAEAVGRMSGPALGHWIWDTLLCQLHYSIAGAQRRLGLTEETIASLSCALNTGLADPHRLETDPEWEALRNHRDFRHLLERVRLIPPVTIDLSSLPAPGQTPCESF